MGNESRITGKTVVVGLIGWPVSHSVSPAMHNRAFERLGLDWRYVPLPVPVQPPQRIGEAVAGIRALGLRGSNVTVPHKQAVMPHLDRLTPAAAAIGAVNTIIVGQDGVLTGDNTDAPGFVADLRDHGVDPAGMHVLLLGAGGSSRAVAYGLAQAGSRSITIANRTASRAENLAAEISSGFHHCRFEVARLPEDVGRSAGHVDLIVNCTSLGMTPAVETTPWPEDVALRANQVVYDLVYNPPETRLLQQAASAGATAIGGFGMLVWQAALAFERWTGQHPDVPAMRAAAEAILWPQ